MKWSLLELNKYNKEPNEFSETFDIKKSLMEREKQLLNVGPVEVTGAIVAEKTDYLLYYKLSVILTLPSSRSLEPVDFALELDVQEIFMTEEQFADRDETVPEEEIIVLEKPTIDLLESIEDNILLAIPIQILTEEEKNSNEMPKGSDWKVISEEDYIHQRESEAAETIDPRLAKLSELLNDDSE
ncbi:YceD family protein [Enterococcus sp. BWT-B8]|uniref:YceD family protein n=1 Tax=unclassified Enterococcus TaxID=2608891 RepID=UPI001E57F693|nr:MULTISPECIES: YceD family protein [unclassified Enterococcus]MCB5952580.1 YceD family protein [Enterococcus sp. BWT-B8]MCB5956460.1 YceD family protein [Enterococcus sp. CWB-B31]